MIPKKRKKTYFVKQMRGMLYCGPNKINGNFGSFLWGGPFSFLLSPGFLISNANHQQNRLKLPYNSLDLVACIPHTNEGRISSSFGGQSQ